MDKRDVQKAHRPGARNDEGARKVDPRRPQRPFRRPRVLHHESPNDYRRHRKILCFALDPRRVAPQCQTTLGHGRPSKWMVAQIEGPAPKQENPRASASQKARIECRQPNSTFHSDHICARCTLVFCPWLCARRC